MTLHEYIKYKILFGRAALFMDGRIVLSKVVSAKKIYILFATSVFQQRGKTKMFILLRWHIR